MKKLSFLFAMGAFISLGLSSCSKCEVCTKDNSNEVRICQKDYGSNTTYGLALDAQEAGGYECKTAP